MSKVFCVLLVFTVLSAALIFPSSAITFDLSSYLSNFTLNSYVRYDLASDGSISGYQSVYIGQDIGLNMPIPGSMVGFSANKYYVTSNSVIIPNFLSAIDSIDFISFILSTTCSDHSLKLLRSFPSDITIPPLTIYALDGDGNRLTDVSALQTGNMIFGCEVTSNYSYVTTSSFYLGDDFPGFLALADENNVEFFEFVFPIVIQSASSISSDYTVSFDLDFMIGYQSHNISDVVINGIPQINNKLTQIDNSVGSIESAVTNIDNTSTQINNSVSSIKSVTDLLPQIYEDLPENMADALRDVILGTVPEVDLHEDEFNSLKEKEDELNSYASDKLSSGLSNSVEKLNTAVATVLPSVPASHDLFFNRLFDIVFIRDIVYISLGFGLMAFVLKVTRKVR